MNEKIVSDEVLNTQDYTCNDCKYNLGNSCKVFGEDKPQTCYYIALIDESAFMDKENDYV